MEIIIDLPFGFPINNIISQDKETDASRFQQVQDTFPELFEKFLEENDIAFPTLQPDWEALSTSFKEHLVGITRHVNHKINPARKHRLAFRANGQPKEAPHGKHLNETFTLSNLNILSVKPNQEPLDNGVEISLFDLRINWIQGWGQGRPPSPSVGPRLLTRPCTNYMSPERNPSRFRAKTANPHGIYIARTF